MILSGTLLTPTGQPFGLALVKLVARETSPSVLQTVAGQFVTDELGAYSFDCPIGRYSILVYTGNAKSNIGNITITEDTTETDINSLIILEQTAIPSNPFLQEIRQSLVDAELAATQAEASATAAATSATQAEAAKDDLLATVIALELDDLQDVVVPTPTTGDALVYNGTTWVNGPVGLSGADKAKLDGIQPGATANATDAFLLSRANHTGTQPASSISDLNESVQDMLSTFLVPGSNVTMVYDDVNNTLTIGSTGGGGGAGGTVETVAISAGALNLSAVTADTVRVALNANVTSLTLPAGEAGKRKDLMIEFTHDNTATVYTVSSTGITWEGGTAAAILNSADAKTYWLLSNVDNTGWTGFVDQYNITLNFLAEAKNTAAPNATVPVVALTVNVAEVNGDLALIPKGTGALTGQVADSTVAGGNKRGLGATDWQRERSAATKVASGTRSVIGGGTDNLASADYCVVSGGYLNTASGLQANVSGGRQNTASGTDSSVGGGFGCSASGLSSTVGGGTSNAASSSYSTIGGGQSNIANTATHTTVAGGFNNTVAGQYAFVGGGYQNYAGGQYSAIAGGWTNNSGGQYSAVLGGAGNVAGGTYSAVLGGSSNAADGTHSTVLGGQFGTARGMAYVEARASGRFSTQGDAQRRRNMLTKSTTDGSTWAAHSEGVQGSAASNTNQFNIPDNSAFMFRGQLVARQNTTGDAACWTFEGLIKRGAGVATTAFVGTPTITKLFGDTGTAAWTPTLFADTTNGLLVVRVTGEASKTIRWVADVETVEVNG